MKTGSDLFTFHAQKPTKSSPTWEGVEVVEYFQKYFDIPEKGKFGFPYWLRKIKETGVKMYHAKKLIEIMKDREAWLRREHNSNLERGKWMTNRFKDIKEVGIDAYIRKNSV